jgi:hypothetical protein
LYSAALTGEPLIFFAFSTKTVSKQPKIDIFDINDISMLPEETEIRHQISLRIESLFVRAHYKFKRTVTGAAIEEKKRG